MWDPAAPVAAIILHLLHVLDERVILPIVLALPGLLFINFMRHARNNEITAEQVEQAVATVNEIRYVLKHPEMKIRSRCGENSPSRKLPVVSGMRR